uniref:Uncharacterized protein n=1 Tax=Macaca fascicularis TaxID=9541 RepID=A0A2K5WCF7_MACFA
MATPSTRPPPPVASMTSATAPALPSRPPSPWPPSSWPPSGVCSKAPEADPLKNKALETWPPSAQGQLRTRTCWSWKCRGVEGWGGQLLTPLLPPPVYHSPTLTCPSPMLTALPPAPYMVLPGWPALGTWHRTHRRHSANAGQARSWECTAVQHQGTGTAAPAEITAVNLSRL